MPEFRIGDMLLPEHWEQADLVLITTNAAVNGKDRLVMGRGIAQQVRDRFPGLDQQLAQLVMSQAQSFTPFAYMSRSYRLFSPPYYLIVPPNWPECNLGIFQVKEKFSDPASLSLIAGSANLLRQWCAAHPQARVHLNFPGIGNGKLERSAVLPIIQQLPGNVVIWELNQS